MSVLGHLSPAPIWIYFEEICNIPRLSKNEEKIRQYLLHFAEEHHLESKEDSVGNILISRPASPGFENRKTVVLQSHMDMVGEKNSDYPHNWNSDPIKPTIKNGWVTATGTTLGADDGMGIAAQMAILTDKNLRAGNIECLFTVDEESGMTGAINLEPGFFSGRILLNLDSEDEGIIFIGCAGGVETEGTLKFSSVLTEGDLSAIEISVTGLHGGHSGDEIHKGYGNSVKIINRILLDLFSHFGVSLARLDGGNLRNAIPRESFATVVIKKEEKNVIVSRIENFNYLLADEYGGLEKDLKITFREVEMPREVMDKESQKKLLNALSCCPHGVIAWSTEMDDLVETSTNLASAKFLPDNKVKIITTQRSSVESSKLYAAGMVESCLTLAGAEVISSEGYPGWKPNLSSEILKIAKYSYLKLFGKEPQVRAIHAGLECGLIYEKIKGIDMISFGPTIKGAHTPEEMIEIKTAQLFWDLLVDVVSNIPDRN
jgi:dipeptidase D